MISLLTTLLAQTDYPMPDQNVQMNPVVGGVVFLIWLAVVLVVIIGMWRVFTKAGEPGWASLIPIYNVYVLCKIAGKPGWWVLLMFIPFVNFLIFIFVCIALAERFGKGAGFGVGLALLSPIFFPVLGFGDARYQGALAGAEPPPLI